MWPADSLDFSFILTQIVNFSVQKYHSCDFHLCSCYVCADSVMVSALNTISMGLDTLEEEEEKARFFTQLEAGASSTIDYSKMNRELDSTSSTIDTNLRYGNDLGLMLQRLKDRNR